GTERGQRRLEALACIGRAADDGALFTVAGNPAYAQAIRVRVWFDRDDLGYHHAVERRSHRLDGIDFQPGKGETFSELCGAQARIHPLAKPAITDLHAVS